MKSKCGWGVGCENEAEYREIITTPTGAKVIWLELCAEHHFQMGEVPVDYEKIGDE